MQTNAKEAQREYMREYRERNREKLREYQKDWQRKNPDKTRRYREKYWERRAAQNATALEGDAD